jgi:hypothetical protein
MTTLAHVIKQLLIDLNIIQTDNTKNWFTTIAYMPDNTSAPDNIVTITDTEGQKDGRIMYSGETIIHPACQIRTRATDYLTGYAKIRQIQQELDKVHNYTTQINNNTITIQTLTQQSTIMPMGIEPQGRRYHWSINYSATIYQHTTEQTYQK